MSKTPVEFVLKQVKLPFELREYQKEDVNEFAYYENSLLAYDLGLGKTVVATMVAAFKLIQGKFKGCTVLCPAVLVQQWYTFLKACGLDVTAYAGTPKQREKLDINLNFLVMSYQMFQKDYDKLKGLKNFFILDESTNMCNVDNVIFKLLQGGEIRKEVKIPGKLKPEMKVRTFEKINNGCCMLTATPVNKPTDAYGLIKIKTPDVYRNYFQFERIHVGKKDFFGQPTEYQNLDLLKENLFLFGKQRLVTDHLDLPEVIYSTVLYDLSEAHMMLYNKLIDERLLTIGDDVAIDAISAQSLYQWSQRIIVSPELGDLKEDPKVFELLDTLIASVNQFIIFANFVMSNKAFIKRYEIGGVFGAATNKDRDIKDFQEGRLRGLAIHPKSGGCGLNLQNCHTILFPELPITPRDFQQSVGRCHRSGQTNTVVVTVMAARGTIQESLLSKIMDKADLMEEIVDVSSSLRSDLSNKMTKKELYAALKGKIKLDKEPQK
jgi:SNF2 family DNA or RNA helicase